MKRNVTLVVAAAVPVLLAALFVPASAAPDGKAVFMAQKCNLCHSIDAAGIARTSKADKTKGPDLGGVAKRHDAAWMKRFLNKEEMLNNKKHLKAFTGTPEELDALIAWVRAQ